MASLSWWKRACIVFLFCAATGIAAPAQGFKNLVSFDGPNGANPYLMSLIQGRDGNFYGTTSSGGANEGGPGTVFRVTPGGVLTTLHSFCAQNGCGDGDQPAAGLVQATDGNFYGTTPFGGPYNTNCFFGGCGTIFKITPAGTLTTLYSFCSQTNCSDGTNPYGGLVEGIDGNLYGTTSGVSTVFKITLGGTLTTLHSFNGTDGIGPMGTLIQAANGNFYGTTIYGGANNFGTVFKITMTGMVTTLYSFCSQTNCADGAYPYGGLALATDGEFYGTTVNGGITNSYCQNSCGTVFRITKDGTLTTLYRFCSQTNCPDGALPYAGLIQATDGSLFGTTYAGGADGAGTIFRISRSGTSIRIHSFDGGGGAGPQGGLLQATNGILYGATEYGGAGGVDGAVFSFSTRLGPFVAFERGAGRVGQTGGILGQGFTGTTSVSLNGISAPFNVVSDTYLTATVPPGATSGFVKVVTPSGTLTSNKPFIVLK
jgi:uncharacterized repeat protein (TIGR03803 family)